MKHYYAIYQTALGPIMLAEADGKLAAASLRETPPAGSENRQTPLLDRAARQLDEYLAGTRRKFDLPLAPAGTPFQQKIWKCLLSIPYGQTRSYGQIAQAAGNPKACRAVGMANNKNPLMIFIPCHRVIGADGSLTGYAGGLDVKTRLLELERSRTQ